MRLNTSARGDFDGEVRTRGEKVHREPASLSDADLWKSSLGRTLSIGLVSAFPPRAGIVIYWVSIVIGLVSSTLTGSLPSLQWTSKFAGKLVKS